MTAPFRFDPNRPVHLALPGGSHTFAMTYAPDGVPVVAVFVGERLDEPACTMIRPDVATAMGALLATHAELRENAQALVAELRATLDEHRSTMATGIGFGLIRLKINAFANKFDL